MAISQLKKHGEVYDIKFYSYRWYNTRVIGDKEPEAILDRMIVKGSNKAVTEVFS